MTMVEEYGATYFRENPNVPVTAVNFAQVHPATAPPNMKPPMLTSDPPDERKPPSRREFIEALKLDIDRKNLKRRADESKATGVPLSSESKSEASSERRAACKWASKIC